MKSTLVMLMMLVLAATFQTGCSGGDTPEALSKDMVANMKEMGAILTSITDETSAKAAVPKIEAVRVKMRDCAKRAKELPKIDAATEQRVNELMQAGMTEAMGSINTAQQRLSSQPELMAIIAPAMQGMENDL